MRFENENNLEYENKTLILFCHPLSKYPEQPKDISEATIICCPLCENKMWFSEKKETIYNIYKALNEETLLLCYDCLEKKMEDDPRFISGSLLVNI